MTRASLFLLQLKRKRLKFYLQGHNIRVIKENSAFVVVPTATVLFSRLCEWKEKHPSVIKARGP